MGDLEELVRKELGARADAMHVGTAPVEGLRERARRRRGLQRAAAAGLATAVATAAGVLVLTLVPGAGSTHGAGPAARPSSSPQEDSTNAPLLRWRDRLPRGGAAPVPGQHVEDGVLTVGGRRFPLPAQQSWRVPDSVFAVADTDRGMLVINTRDPAVQGADPYVEAGFLTERGEYSVAVDRAVWVITPAYVAGKVDRFAWAEVAATTGGSLPQQNATVHVVRVSDGAQLASAEMPVEPPVWTMVGLVAGTTTSTLGPQGWTVWDPGSSPRVVADPTSLAVPDSYPNNIPKPGMTQASDSLVSGRVAATNGECEAVVSLAAQPGAGVVWKRCEPDSIAAPSFLSPDGRYLLRLGLMELVDVDTGRRTLLTDLPPATVRAAALATPGWGATWSPDSATVDIDLVAEPMGAGPPPRQEGHEVWFRCEAATGACKRLD